MDNIKKMFIKYLLYTKFVAYKTIGNSIGFQWKYQRNDLTKVTFHRVNIPDAIIIESIYLIFCNKCIS